MLEFPWNKKTKNLNGKKAATVQGEGKPERVPYTLDEVDDLIQKYNTRGKQASMPHDRQSNGKEVPTAKEKLTVKRQPDMRPVSKTTQKADSDMRTEVTAIRAMQAEKEIPAGNDSGLFIPEKEMQYDQTADSMTQENEVSSGGGKVSEDTIDEQIKEKIESGERIVFFEGEETEPEFKITEEHHPQLEALAEWIKNKLFESLWGLFISDLNGEKIYARYGFQNTDLKNLLLIPPVVDVELQNDLQQGKVRESLFRTDRNKMLYYMDIENFRIALFLDEEKLNMGMLFSIVKPAIEQRIKKMGPIS